MSLKAMMWAINDAPVENPHEHVILIALADASRDNGITWRGRATLADCARCSERTVTRHLKAMEERGLIKRATHPGVEKIRADRRPTVWKLNLNMRRVRDLIDDDDFPDGPPSRGDNVSPRTHATGRQTEHHGVTNGASRGDTAVSTETRDEPKDEPTTKNVPAPPGPGQALAPILRPDVESLCSELRDRMIANGCRPPTITQAWRDAARLLLDRDGISPEEARAGILWCTQDDFWKTNILSMPTYRKQFDKLKLSARRQQLQQQPQRSTVDEKSQGWVDLQPAEGYVPPWRQRSAE